MFFAILVFLVIGIDGQVYQRELHTEARYETRQECLLAVSEAAQEMIPQNEEIAGFQVTCINLPRV
jgi:hypothetical protein